MRQQHQCIMLSITSAYYGSNWNEEAWGREALLCIWVVGRRAREGCKGMRLDEKLENEYLWISVI